MPRREWTRFRTQAGSDIGRKAVKVWICRGCEAWHDTKHPVQCSYCGRMDFDSFPSKTEAKDHMRFRMLEKRGKIANVRRQVPYPLFTIDQGGKPVQFATYIADYVFDDLETGQTGVIYDSKGEAIAPEAKLKLRCMEVSGRTVKLTL